MAWLLNLQPSLANGFAIRWETPLRGSSG